jgi:hypothetical protein
MFDEFEKVLLAKYNETQKVPVDRYDRYFKAYLIGAMSVLISDTAYKNSIRNHKKESK